MADILIHLTWLQRNLYAGQKATEPYMEQQTAWQMVIAAMKLKDACSLKEKLWQTWTVYYCSSLIICRRSPEHLGTAEPWQTFKEPRQPEKMLLLSGNFRIYKDPVGALRGICVIVWPHNGENGNFWRHENKEEFKGKFLSLHSWGWFVVSKLQMDPSGLLAAHMPYGKSFTLWGVKYTNPARVKICTL